MSQEWEEDEAEEVAEKEQEVEDKEEEDRVHVRGRQKDGGVRGGLGRRRRRV